MSSGIASGIYIPDINLMFFVFTNATHETITTHHKEMIIAGCNLYGVLPCRNCIWRPGTNAVFDSKMYKCAFRSDSNCKIITRSQIHNIGPAGNIPSMKACHHNSTIRFQT